MTSGQSVQKWADIGVMVFAAIAAIFWLMSAWGTLPPMVTYWDQAPANDPFYAALRHSAWMNTAAASASALSIGCMAIGAWQRWRS